jgi:two-component system, LytTR family, response regulator
MKKIKVVIVEDDEIQRQHLEYLLSLQPDIEIAGIYEETALAWRAINDEKTDGVLLDISIVSEGCRAGLDLAKRIDRLPPPKPWIIFTTAHSEHSLEAIDIRPFGYLVKPISDLRVTQVFDRIRRSSSEALSQPPAKRIEIRHKKTVNGETLWCTNFVYEDDIKFIQSNIGVNGTRVNLTGGEILEGINKTLKEWLEDENLPHFTPIHRSHLVNINRIKGYKPDPFREDNCFVATFIDCNVELPISKKYMDAFRIALNGKS